MRALVVTAVVLAAAGSLSCDRRADAPARPIVVFAAASMADAIEDAADAFTRETGRTLRTSAAASSTLARQIMAGADADVFISADERWMDELEGAGRIVESSRVDIAANRLVLVAPVDRPGGINLDAAPPAIGLLAIADPAHVPAGRYAREALESLGWWSALEDRLITTPDVRAALRFVEIAEADAGVVYATDAQASDRVRVVAALPDNLHTPIRYPAALCAGVGDGGEAFLAYLCSPAGAAALERHGFTALIGRPEASGP